MSNLNIQKPSLLFFQLKIKNKLHKSLFKDLFCVIKMDVIQPSLQFEKPELFFVSFEQSPNHLINPLGQIYSINNSIILKPYISSTKNAVNIKIKGKTIYIAIYKIVAKLFVPNPKNYKYILFKDGNTLNDRWDNLIWYDNPEGYLETIKWCPIIRFPKYEMSEYGVRNKITRKTLKATYNDKYDEYPKITLSDEDCFEHSISIHILMAECFHPNPNNLPFVNHKDGNKQNYHHSNLEWCTASENLKHAIKTGLRSTETKNGHHMEVLSPSGKLLKTCKSVIETAAFIGTNRDKIYNEFRKYGGAKHGILLRINDYFVRYKDESLLEGEIFKPLNTKIEQLNKNYEISNKGRIKNFKTGRLMIPIKNNQGYMIISISENSRKYTRSIHRLMAFAFLTFTNREDQVNHIDKIRDHNVIENLQFLSSEDHMAKDHGIPIIRVNHIDKKYKVYNSISKAERSLKAANNIIGKASKYGKVSHGFQWFHLDSEEAEEIMIIYEQE